MNDWVTEVANSIPEHAKEVKDKLLSAINNSTLDKVDTHACALASAISSGNGELAFEISMNSPIIGLNEREAAKSAAAVVGINSAYQLFANQELSKLDFELVSSTKLEMYALASSVASGYRYGIEQYSQSLKTQLSESDLNSIGEISAVVSAIGKVAL